ncbi:hypothetical protein LSTR_LSTR004456 [Laodelphax striatellus]|uniref:Large ribosomal subunit protein mL43 n=1 Tax=Laodelphax striatellus TaxID=195883 RepID=A0A482XA24_LAOST|nr:hypothetical protein LSTR_LSTR004456 [Laodelphax striatellus]
MSNSHLLLLSGFPRAPLQNGIGRYVPQLKRMTIKFCKSSGDSKGTREFIESKLVDFAKENPGTVVYVKPRRHRAPCVQAEYLNGEEHHISLHNMSLEETTKWINLLPMRSGRPTNLRLRKYWHTDSPSIQGVWSPFTNRDPALNLAQFPMEEFSKRKNLTKTATEIILERWQEQKEKDSTAPVQEKTTS